MKKILISFIMMTSILMVNCQTPMNFKVDVSLINLSNITYDSVSVRIFPNKTATFYDIEPQDTIIKTFEYKSFVYPKGEHGAATIAVFKDDYYYICGNGLIDVPFAYLDNVYSFYTWDNGVHSKKEIKPNGDFAKKHKISEIK
ncbi:hypothetical protein [Flavobacterium rhizosphaerae]|uniref:Lipoprotein n=1 Tax=Flavobacterium rhizosphaerae TaxID=3163298 RepID=A0ABW8YUZ9_9FLAO